MNHRRKLDWARQHLDRVKAEISAFLDSNPYRTVPTYYEEGGHKHVLYRLWMDRRYPDHLVFMIADCLHNLRASLDHLAFAASPGAGERVSKVAFPIFQSHKGFQQIAPQQIAGMSPELQTRMESLQPYHGGQSIDTHPLWLVKRLDDVDKHRHPLSAAVFITEARLQMRSHDVAVEGVGIQYVTADHGAELGRFRIYQTGPRPEVDMNLKCAFGIAFSEEGPARAAPVIHTLDQIHDHIRNTIFPAIEDSLH